ncbi:membrane-bound O-acyltransferase family protein [candidate division BRC1 bacterium HGW-BRC1-1]|jgi:D-alanyl-lipoteichoic acid acyltransferase DltB (MBOAT superfamily)|nr:MAG: membrane-bound O-acyltransferase family protein [candidate division BRC1 bacterium HGW-BRC1-1]
MVFNTPEFFVFFFIVLILYYVLNRKWQNVLLVVSSYVFYGWWDARFCILLAISTILDWICGFYLQGKHKKFWLWLSVGGQLSMLGFFKYFNFFEDSVRTLIESMGMNADWPTLKVILPVGISFYTFQTLSYTIDIYRGKLKPVRSLMDFAVFVSFWPHLVAGPILRASYLLPQVLSPRRVTMREWSEGTYFILVGLVKKVAIADVIAIGITPGVQNPENFSSWQLLLTIYLFSIRILCDFSGYTDIARGASLFLGFRLVENFHYPYFSFGIQDFWRRWHVSLSSWLRDYLYISLGGNRKGTFRTYFNLFVTMLLGGLWHGASWSFVVWGALHGFYLAIGRMIGGWVEKVESRFASIHLGLLFRIVGIILTFHLVTFTWIFFVITDFSVAFSYVRRLLEFTYLPDPNLLRLCLYGSGLLLLCDGTEMIAKRHEWLVDKPVWFRTAIYAGFIALLSVTWTDNYEPFIYFQF